MRDEEIEELDKQASISTRECSTNDNGEPSNDDMYNAQQRSLYPSCIITTTVIGMKATIFEYDRKCEIWLNK